MATTRIQKWGNSFGLRIPKTIIDELELRPDTQLEIHQEEGRIIITPVREPKVSLEELLAKITPDNMHGEVDWGSAAGREEW